MLALDELAEIFNFQIDASGNGTANITYGSDVILLTSDQQVISVAGRLTSLRIGPKQTENGWIVPLEFLNRAVAPLIGERIEVRRLSRLILVGDVVVPRVSAQYRRQNDGENLVLEVIPSTPYTVNQENAQLVILFEADALDIEQLSDLSGDLVAGISQNPSSASLVVNLEPAFDTFRVSNRSIRNDGDEVNIAMTSSSPIATADPAPRALPPNPVSSTNLDPLPDLTTSPTVQVVAIDAGHGGSDTGTSSEAGTLEKDVTLSVARRLRDAIQNQLGLRVVLTRSGDNLVPIDARAEVANNNKADLFISLHVNASIRPSVSGAEVFYLSMEEYDEEARALEERDVQLVPVIGGGMREIDLVEWDMAQVTYLGRSARLADIVHEELGRRVPMSSRDVQQAPLRVLVGANMPAVLIEMGFVSNETDEERLQTTRFQDAVVDALIDSILRFRSYVELVGYPVADTEGNNDSGNTQVRNQ
tara:strand:- start:27357 stop:28784 length:1428 start_codon:yes stop_codon:yes gene_type:complete